MLRMSKSSLFLAAALAALAGMGAEETPLDIWAYPGISARHIALASMMKDAVRTGDTASFERIARAGVELIPGDPVWHYNLACALAWHENHDEAFAELAKAIRFGFRDARTIENDRDLKRLKGDPRFAILLDEARKTAGLPIPGKPRAKPLKAPAGGTVTMPASAVAWNFDTSMFDCSLVLDEKTKPSAVASRYQGPVGELLCAWMSEGSAAGNAGDIYMNRDRNHSRLDIRMFPLLTEVKWPKEAVDADVDLDIPNALFPGHAVFGNASRARVGYLGRSLIRAAVTGPEGAERLSRAYLDNQFWVFPTVKDYDPDGIGDVFPSMQPFALAARGTSGADIPFVAAATAASAAFRKPTKSALISRKLMAPTIQWLIRRSQKGVTTDEDYLSPKAHPTAFEKDNLDMKRMMELAHSLKPSEIPPVAHLAAVNSRLSPIPQPVPGVDYPDCFSEPIYATPCSIAFALRAPHAIRRFIIRAQVPGDRSAVFHWTVVGGDASCVKIATPEKESTLSPELGLAEITIDRRNLTGRIDIAVFAKRPGTGWGAPSFISFWPVPQEERTYLEDGRISSIDYTNPSARYSDPLLAYRRNWRDEYVWGEDGRLERIVRKRDGVPVHSFLPDGRRIVTVSNAGKPLSAVGVKYIVREMGDDLPPELTYVDEGLPKAVK